MAYASSSLKVILADNSSCRMTPGALDLALRHGQVKQFHRADGWAVVGLSPIRGERSFRGYSGPERRGQGCLHA